MSAEAMYAEIIMDYYRNPKNYGKMEHPDAQSKDVNISCGDEVEIHMAIGKGKIRDILFSGKGCAISLAATSMLTEAVRGKDINEAIVLKKEDVLALLSIPVSPMRLKCALLGLKVFKMAAYQFLGKLNEEEQHG